MEELQSICVLHTLPVSSACLQTCFSRLNCFWSYCSLLLLLISTNLLEETQHFYLFLILVLVRVCDSTWNWRLSWTRSLLALLLVWTTICCSCWCTDALKESAAPAALRLEAGSRKPKIQKLQELMHWSASVLSTSSSSPYVSPCCVCFLLLLLLLLSASSVLLFLPSLYLALSPSRSFIGSQGPHLNSNVTNWLYKVIIVEHLFILPLILVPFNSWFFAIIPWLYWVFCKPRCAAVTFLAEGEPRNISPQR